MGTSIRVGILFSLSGTMEISERGQYQAALLANEEVNQNGLVYWYYIKMLSAADVQRKKLDDEMLAELEEWAMNIVIS